MVCLCAVDHGLQRLECEVEHLFAFCVFAVDFVCISLRCGPHGGVFSLQFFFKILFPLGSDSEVV